MIDEKEIIRLVGKFDIPFEYMYELEPYEFLCILEGKLEMQREYFEFFNYSLYSSIGQLLSTKTKKFENPFEKKVEKEIKTPTKEEEAETFKTLEEIFNVQAE